MNSRQPKGTRRTAGAFRDILLGFLGADFRITRAVAEGCVTQFFVSIAVEALAILGFVIAANLWNPYWYLACALVTALASLWQFACFAAPSTLIIANLELMHAVLRITSETLTAAKQPLEKIKAVVNEIRARFTEIIAQTKGQTWDALMTTVNEALRLFEIPAGVASSLVDPIQRAIDNADRTIQQLPGNVRQRVKKVAGPVLHGFLVFQWLSIAFWALLAFSPKAATDFSVPLAVTMVGIALTAVSLPYRNRGGLPWLGFASSVCIIIFGAWGVAMPEHWQTLERKAGAKSRVAHEEVEVLVPGQIYRKDGELCEAVSKTHLAKGTRIRLAKSPIFRDQWGDIFVEVLGAVNPATGLIDHRAETFYFPKGSLSDPIPEEERGPKFMRPTARTVDPNAIWDLTGAEPVQVVSFNPASRPMAVTTNTTITHPLGDHRIMPAVHYGITQQWDSKTNWGSVFPAPRDSPVYAAAAGTVIGVYAAAPGSVSGVVIRHEPEQGTFYTRYLEVGEILVALGDNVAQNQVIARSDGKPGAPGARSDSREAHVRLEVWCMTQEYQAYFPVDPMTWIEGVNYQKIWVGPKEFLAYPIYPIPGTRDVYEFPVNRPVSVIANPVSAGDVVSIQVLDPQDASYVLNAQQRDSLWYRELITVKGKAYPVAPDGRTMWWQLYRFYTSHERAAYGQLIAGVNGFADAIPLDYGERELYASKDGWVCLGINDAVGILANNEQITDRSVDNYTKGGTRNVIRIKVAIN